MGRQRTSTIDGSGAPGVLSICGKLAVRSLALVFLALPSPASQAKDAAPQWFTGKAFTRQLEQPTNIACSGRPLGAAIGSLAAAQRVAIWLDRRVDPDQPVSLSLTAEPLRAVIDEIASQRELGVSGVGAVVYLGPPSAAEKLRTLAYLRQEDLKRLPAPRRKALAELRTWRWDDLATPRELVTGLARDAHVEVHSLELVPHDLWPARTLPALAWTDRLTLLAIQFDLTFQIAPDGKSVELVKVPETVVASRSYPAGTRPREQLAVLAQQYPQAEVRVKGDHIVVEARVEDLETLVAGVTASGRATQRVTSPGKQVYKLTAEQPLDVLIEDLGKRLNLDFQLDQAAIERAGISLKQIVPIKVENASLDELIQALLGPAGLKGSRQGRTVRVSPAR